MMPMQISQRKRFFMFTLTLLVLCPLIGFLNVVHGEVQDTESTRFWHLSIVVNDMERMHDFYTRILGLVNTTDLAFADPDSVKITDGMTPVKNLDQLMDTEKTSVRIRHYSTPGHEQLLEFLHYPNRPAEYTEQSNYSPMGWSHLGLEVSDMDQIVDMIISEKNGTVVSAPTILDEFGGNMFVFIKDPEGNIIELYEKIK